MEITSTSSAQANQTSSFGSAAQDIMGKDDFLQLLITQLRHQDPLNPVDNEAFIAQLAQFSSLEQMQNMNDSLQTGISTDLVMAQSISNSMVTNLIGKEVRVQTDQIAVEENGEVKLGYLADSSTVSGTVSIYDSNGKLVFSKDLSGIQAGENEYVWKTENSQGSKVEPGSYRFEISLSGPDSEPQNTLTWQSGEVTAVKYMGDGAVISVNGQLFNVGDVMEVRLRG